MQQDTLQRATLQAILHAPLSGLDDELHLELGLGRASLSEDTYWGERTLSEGHHTYNSIEEPHPKHVEEWLADVMETTGYSKAFLCGDDGLHALTLGLVRSSLWQQYGIKDIETMSPAELSEVRLDHLVGLSRLDDERRKRELEHGLDWIRAHSRDIAASYPRALPARRNTALHLFNYLTWPELLLIMSWLWTEGPAGFPDLLVTPPLASPFFAEVEAEGDRLDPDSRRCMDYLVHTAGIRCRIVRVRDANKDETSYHEQIESKIRSARDPRSQFFMAFRDISNRLELDLPFYEQREHALEELEQRLIARKDKLQESTPADTQKRLLGLAKTVDPELHAALHRVFAGRKHLSSSEPTRQPERAVGTTREQTRSVAEWLGAHPLVIGAGVGLIVAILSAIGVLTYLLLA